MRCAPIRIGARYDDVAQRKDQDRACNQAGHRQRQNDGEENPRNTGAEQARSVDLVQRNRLQARDQYQYRERDVLIGQHGDERREGAQPLQAARSRGRAKTRFAE